MSRAISRLIGRVQQLADQGCVSFTRKAYRELATLDEPITETEALEILRTLTADNYAQRIKSHVSGEPMHVFKIMQGQLRLYIKFIVRDFCVIISFHEDKENA